MVPENGQDAVSKAESPAVAERWIADDWISPPPVEEIEAAVAELE